MVSHCSDRVGEAADGYVVPVLVQREMLEEEEESMDGKGFGFHGAGAGWVLGDDPGVVVPGALKVVHDTETVGETEAVMRWVRYSQQTQAAMAAAHSMVREDALGSARA